MPHCSRRLVSCAASSTWRNAICDVVRHVSRKWPRCARLFGCHQLVDCGISDYESSELSLSNQTSSLPGMPFNCFAPASGCSQLTRCGAYSSTSGFTSLSALRLSKIPTLTTLFSPKVAVSRHMLVPQSPQNEVVTSEPESDFLIHVLGVPDVTWKPSLGMMMLVL